MPALLVEADQLSAWAGEPILWHEGAIAPGELDPQRLRGQALAAARMEHSLQLAAPSMHWRRRYGFVLGLSRMTASDPVRLAGGIQLAEHQVEALEALQAALTARLEGETLSPQAKPTAADPNRSSRFWIQHATGSGKSVVACALADAARTGSVLILTHRSNLVEQFRGELAAHGYGHRLTDVSDIDDPAHPHPICVTTYQYWSRSWTDHDPDAFSLVVCDEVHQTLGAVTSNAIRAFEDVPVIGMTATGQLIGKDVSSLFPSQVSQFDLVQAAHAEVISPLRCIRIPPALGMETLERVRQRAGDFDQDQLAQALDRDPLNFACAQLYSDMFGDRAGVIYTAGVRHAERLAVAFLSAGISAVAVSGKTPKQELARVLADYQAGRLRVIMNAALLTEGWNSPRATVCLHLAPTCSPRIYQQRVGRVTRRDVGKSAGIVVDFVDPSYRNDGKVVTLHSLLDLDEYRSGEAVTAGPSGVVPLPEPPIVWDPMVVAPVSADPERRRQVLTRSWSQISADRLSGEDRMLWARAAGSGAQTTGHLKRALDRLAASEHDRDGVRSTGLTVACLQAAADNPRQDCRQLATDRLMILAGSDDQAWQALAEVAERTEQAMLQRRLAQHAIALAADGAADTVGAAHGYLLELARTERPAYERVARKTALVTRIVGNAPMPDDPVLVDQLALRAMTCPRAEAVALLVALPARRPRTEATVMEAISQLFPAPTDLARALQDARTMV